MIALATDLPGLVSLHARRAPSSPAIRAHGVTIDYATLDARGEAVAAVLQRLRVARGDIVGVYMERSISAIVAALGVMRAGAAFLPLDPAHPLDRVAFTSRDADARIILVNGSGSEFERRGFRTVKLGLAGDIVGAGASQSPSMPMEPADLAYMIYTSGSTGEPKGVELTHGGLNALVRWHIDAFGVGPDDRASQLAAVGFDAAVWEVWPYLAAGASVHVVPADVVPDSDALAQWLITNAITIGFAPTPLAERLMQREWSREVPLRYLLTGGDRLVTAPSAALPFRLVNNYGPTECTVVATSGIVEPGTADGSPPIGRPITGTTVTIADADGRPVPAGEVGEIWIGGAGVARGYRGRPALTAAKFVPDPRSAQDGLRTFRTGDSGRLLPDGQIAFVGRLDDQVKIRGFRIEPGEIESTLKLHRSVRASAVVAAAGASGDTMLTAFVVAAEPAPTAHELRTFAADRLPKYMVPARVVFMPALPENGNGKIDRDQLRQLAAGDEGDTPYTAPATDAEVRLVQIMTELLDVERVGADDDFFELGGHSLLATQLITRVHDAFRVRLTLRDIFRATTVRDLARELERRR